MRGWIGVDLDGTLAEHYWPEKGPYDPHRIGDPIPRMVERVKAWLEDGVEVRIFTARVDGGNVAACDPNIPREWVAKHNDVEGICNVIAAWTEAHVGTALRATCTKDYGMVELWDDRAIRVVHNTGERCCG